MRFPRAQNSARQCQCAHQSRTVEIFFRNHNAARRVGVSAEEFRRAVNNKIRAEIYRLANKGVAKVLSTISFAPDFVRDFRDVFNIQNFQKRIRNRFADQNSWF